MVAMRTKAIAPMTENRGGGGMGRRKMGEGKEAAQERWGGGGGGRGREVGDVDRYSHGDGKKSSTEVDALRGTEQ